MKVKRLICFVMAFAMMLGTMSVAFAAVTSLYYSKTGCIHSFITTNYVGSNSHPARYNGIKDDCTGVSYENNTADFQYHYSRVVLVNNSEPIGDYTLVLKNNEVLVPITNNQANYGAIRLQIQSAYSHSNISPASHKMSTTGSFTADMPIIN